MALITNTDSSVLPYNDDYMEYDIDEHMYVLTDYGVRQLIGEDLVVLTGSTTKSKMVRYEVSRDIMNYISMYSRMQAYKYKQWLLAKDENMRDVIKRVLADQMRYYIRSGAGLLKDMHGINIANNKVMDLNQIRGRALISYSAEQMLMQSGLLYVGTMYYSQYEEDGSW
jgi:hypothetical protein